MDCDYKNISKICTQSTKKWYYMDEMKIKSKK